MGVVQTVLTVMTDELVVVRVALGRVCAGVPWNAIVLI